MPNELRVSVAGSADRPAWEAFVQAHGDDAGYHAWDWQRVFEDAFGHEPAQSQFLGRSVPSVRARDSPASLEP